ncbi:hypothetical protein EI94DRAFT_1699837 [Lactarius quietus]|nr:hypothetical protein EI94DRAFT_1699837 [Lactarius quietus]
MRGFGVALHARYLYSASGLYTTMFSILSRVTESGHRSRIQDLFIEDCLEWNQASKWSEEEESQLTQILRDLSEEGLTAKTTPMFWKEVLRNDSLSLEVRSHGRTPHWHDTDLQVLVQKVALTWKMQSEGMS